ncbi:transcription/translation regulatory transformer protein RfaH [Marinospirillum sp. MEB164]|uniref:Transcription/translation regulatory transformer protein RfaH n=1 Tax=Marinospirillum alkalitolerans TaxID=3123374 RepID=A0ABW8PXY1_9GAMM
MTQRSWYAIQCKAKESFRAVEHLEAQGYIVFHPTLQVEKVKRGRLTYQEEPLFPYYAFIQLCRTSDNWRPIRSTRGVLKLLSFGQEPVQVPDALIQSLQQPQQSTTQHLYTPGQKLRITSGPFQGLDAILACTKGEDRVVLLLELLQKEQRITLKVNAVQPA